MKWLIGTGTERCRLTHSGVDPYNHPVILIQKKAASRFSMTTAFYVGQDLISS